VSKEIASDMGDHSNDHSLRTDPEIKKVCEDAHKDPNSLSPQEKIVLLHHLSQMPAYISQDLGIKLGPLIPTH
jgi:hypothetical protein